MNIKFQIKEGLWGIPAFGKYAPNITFLTEKEEIEWEYKEIEDFNLPSYEGRISQISGRYFISKKGKPCFSLVGEKPHYLIKVSWGGSFNSTRGRYPFPEDIFYRRASSNGGGEGNTYWVIPVGWKYVPPQEEYEEE